MPRSTSTCAPSLTSLAALSGVNGVLVSPGCISLGTEIFIASKNVACNLSEHAPEGTQKLLFRAGMAGFSPATRLFWLLRGGGFGGVDERAHLRGILFPRRNFHAARNVHAKGPHFANGFSHVLRCQSAGKEDRFAEFLRLDSQVPVEFFSRTAHRF